MMNIGIKKQLKKIKVLRMTKKMFDEVLNKIRRIINGIGSKKNCYICGKTFSQFTKFRGGSKGILKSEFREKLDLVGSDIDNFCCMFCGSHDRERHLFMYFDKLSLWEKMKNRKILHFAPEKHIEIKIIEQVPMEYVKADLYPQNADIRKVDITDIPFNNDSFDFIIANHILEHIPDYRKALFELNRILKPGGIAILQTPYSKLLKNNFEDDGLDSDELRLFFQGQEDHVRTFGEYQFLKSLEEAGFSLQIKKHKDYFDIKTAYYYGVPIEEDLIMVEIRTNK